MWFRTNTEYRKKVKKYQEELYSYGIQEADLPKLPLEYWVELVEAFKIVYEEFPKVFKYFEGFKDADDTDTCVCRMYLKYKDYQKCSKLGYIAINVKNISSEEAEEKRKLCKKENYHKCDSFKSYIIHELAHFVENVVTFAEDTFQHTLTEEWFSEYTADLQLFKTSHSIIFRAYGNLDIKGILGKEAYGSTNETEFLAEAVSEYFCLEEHQKYMEDMYMQLKDQYNKYF
ncbi:hypothetical protein IMSAGC009_03236 [Lachnospiraceae bacterium]|nr:hypothetical protein IMSAGC009_03236 [Lachnospiraceae bacterium]